MIARAEAKREFRGLFRKRGLLEEQGLTSYYDAKFGHYEREKEAWGHGKASLFSANPQLRRVDVVADALFTDGLYRLLGLGDVVSRRGNMEGTIATVRLQNCERTLSGMLTLDVGGETRFTKLRIGEIETRSVFTIRPSALDRGIVVEPDEDDRIERELPLSVHDRSIDPIRVFQTVADAIDALRVIFGKN